MKRVKFVIRFLALAAVIGWSFNGLRAQPDAEKNGKPQAQSPGGESLIPTNIIKVTPLWQPQQSTRQADTSQESVKIVFGNALHAGHYRVFPCSTNPVSEEQALQIGTDRKVDAVVIVSVLTLKSEVCTAPARVKTSGDSGTNNVDTLQTMSNTVSSIEGTVTSAETIASNAANFGEKAGDFFRNFGKAFSGGKPSSESPPKESPSSSGNVPKGNPPTPGSAAESKGPAQPATYNNICTMSARVLSVPDGEELWSDEATATNSASPSQTNYDEAITTAASALARAIPASTGKN